MKVETKNNLKVAFIVFLLMAISVALFYFKHTSLSIYFSIIGIPILLVAYSISFVKKRTRERKDPSLILKEEDVQRIISDYRELESRLDDMQNKYGIETSSLKADIDNLVSNDFPGVGISAKGSGDLLSINYSDSVIAKKDILVFENVSSNLNSILKRSDEKFRDYTHSLSNNLLVLLEDLRAAGYDVGSDISALRQTIDSHNLSERMDDNLPFIDSLDSVFSIAVNRCIDHSLRLKNNLSEMNRDVSSIEDEIEKVRVLGGIRNYAKRVEVLKDIMVKIESSMSGDFGAIKGKSLDAIQSILNSIRDFEDENQAKLEELKNRVSLLSSPSKISELKRFNSEIIPISNRLINALQQNIDENENKIRKFNVPEGSYLFDKSYLEGFSSVQKKSDLSDYVNSYIEVTEKMMGILEKSKEKVGILSAYAKIRRKIQRELDTKGSVSQEDLGIKKSEEFISLFAAENPNVLYDSINQTLTLIGGRPVCSLKIKVSTETSKQLLQNTEFLLRQGTKTVASEFSDSQGEVSFQDLPKGEYTISVNMAGYRNISQKLILEKDENLEILLKEVPVGEKLCKGKEEKLKKFIQSSDNELSMMLQEKYFVASNSDLRLKINMEFIPCLLYLWSKGKENLKFIEGGEGIFLVYDEKHARAELKNILREMEPGSRESLEELRDYFSAPLPDKEIFTLLDELKKESDVYTNISYEDEGFIIKEY